MQNSTLQGRGMFRSTIPKLFPIVQIAAQRSSSIVKYLANWFGSLRTRRYRNSIVGMILNQTWWRRLSALGGGGGRLWHWGLIRRGGGVAGARAIVASSVPGASRARYLCAIHSSRVPTSPHATSRTQWPLHLLWSVTRIVILLRFFNVYKVLNNVKF